VEVWQTSNLRPLTLGEEKKEKKEELKCGRMSNVMVALLNIGGALCSTQQSLTDAHYHSACSNAAKMINPLKLAGVPQT